MTAALTRSPAQFQRPFCEVTTASQSVANSTSTVADLPTSATVDNGLATCGTALLDGANNRVYLRRAGVWLISTITSWTANGTGYRVLTLQIGGSGVLAQNVNNTFGGNTTRQALDSLYYSTGGSTYVSALVYQNSGGALSTTTTLRATWLGALS